MTCTRWGRATGKVFASAYDDSSVKVFAMGVKQPVLNLTGLEAVGTGLAFNPTEEVLAGGASIFAFFVSFAQKCICTGDAKGTVTLWSLKQGKVARTLEGTLFSIQLLLKEDRTPPHQNLPQAVPRRSPTLPFILAALLLPLLDMT